MTTPGSEETSAPFAHRLLRGSALATILALHVWLTFHFERPEVVLSSTPLGGADFDTHYGQASRFIDAMQGWGETWSYDPSLLAGRPAGVLFDCDNKAWALWTYGLHAAGLSRGLSFNSFVLVAFFVAPTAVFAAARLFRLGWAAALLATLVASLAWFFDSQTHYFWWIGMVTWALGSHLSLLCLGTFYRFVRAPGPTWAAATATALSLCLLVHPFTFLVLAPSMTFLWVRARPGLALAEHGQVVGIAAVALLANAFWLWPALRFFHYSVSFAYFGQARPVALLHDLLELAIDPDDTGLYMRTGLRFLILGAGIAGLSTWRRDGDDRWAPLAATILWLVVESYLGRYTWLTAQVQPYRYIVPATLLGLLPAAAFVTDPRTLRAVREASRPVKLLLVVAFVPAAQLLATDALYHFPSVIPPQAGRGPEPVELLSPTGYPRHPDRRHAPLPVGGDALPDWFAAHRETEGRVLVEPSVVGERLAARVPGIEVMGGIRERNLLHAQANFFRRHPDRAASPDEFRRYLEQYAIRWVVLQAGRPFPAPFAELLRVRAKLPDGVICETTTPVSFLQGGSGHAHASMNRIEIRGSDPAVAAVLRYHWLETLVCEPACRIEREPLPDDPVGFIRVPAPHAADFIVRNAY